MPSFSETSRQKLTTCDPRLQDILNEAIQYVDFMILEGHRGQAAQDEAVRKGNSQKPWPTGNHNSLPSKAVDVAPLSSQLNDKLSWKDIVAFGRLMGYIDCIAKRQGVKLRFGLDWDGDFRTVGLDPNEKFLDAPHVEIVDG
jgi:peptidoglycan L-alanyl-D-glutamate endopeptidase CwlK